jgi:hypothetical protein
LIPDNVIDHIIFPLLYTKVLHYLKCAENKWRTKIEEYAKNSVPMFKFIANFGSNDSVNGKFNSPFFVTTDKQGNIYASDCDNHRIQIFNSNG